MYEQIGEAVTALFKAMAWGLVIFVPLGLWKLIEIVVWLFRNVTINFGG